MIACGRKKIGVFGAGQMITLRSDTHTGVEKPKRFVFSRFSVPQQLLGLRCRRVRNVVSLFVSVCVVLTRLRETIL